MCTVLQRDECFSFKSQKETNKKPDWPFRLRSVNSPNQVSQHKLPALLLTTSQEIPILLSPNSNHEHNTFANENARCPFPLLLVFTPFIQVIPSHLAYHVSGCLNYFLYKMYVSFNLKKIRCKCMQDFRIFA